MFLRLLKDHRESEKIRQEEVEEILHADMGKMQFNCVAMAVEFAEEGVSKRNICAEFMRSNWQKHMRIRSYGGRFYMKRILIVLFLEKERAF